MADRVRVIGILDRPARTPITILVNPGRFGSVAAAAVSDDSVDWWDADTTDEAACTESFAASELEAFLQRVTGLADSEVRIERAENLPQRGDVFVLGTRSSNPLVAEIGRRKKPAPSENPDAFHLYSV